MTDRPLTPDEEQSLTYVAEACQTLAVSASDDYPNLVGGVEGNRAIAEIDKLRRMVSIDEWTHKEFGVLPDDRLDDDLDLDAARAALDEADGLAPLPRRTGRDNTDCPT